MSKKNTKKHRINDDDFNETLLRIKENDNNDIKEVDEDVEKNIHETDLATFVAKNKWQVYQNIANIFTKRSENDNKLKEKYSIILIVILVIQLLFMNTTLVLKGLNILQFSDTVFNIFITGTILEVFSLITIIVKYLFTDNLTKLLSNILTEAKEEKENKKD